MIDKIIITRTAVYHAGEPVWGWTAFENEGVKRSDLTQSPNIVECLRSVAVALDLKDPVDIAYDVLRQRGALCADVTQAMLKVAVAAALEAAKVAK